MSTDMIGKMLNTIDSYSDYVLDIETSSSLVLSPKKLVLRVITTQDLDLVSIVK